MRSLKKVETKLTENIEKTNEQQNQMEENQDNNSNKFEELTIEIKKRLSSQDGQRFWRHF